MPATLIDEHGRVVCARCEVADTLRARARGLLARRSLEAGEGLLLPHTGSVHTFFMRFPIDVVFLDRSMRVQQITRDVRPFRIALRLGAKNALELAAGEADRVGLEPGSTLSLAR